MAHPPDVQTAIDAVRADGENVAYLPSGVQAPIQALRDEFWPLRRWARRYGSYHGYDTGGGVYTANAVNFDGTNDWLTSSGDLTGVSDSKVFTCSIWLRRTADLVLRITANTGFNFALFYQTAVTDRLTVLAENVAGTVILTSDFVLPYNTAWHHWLLSFNLANASERWCYIDDVSVSGTWSPYTDDTIDFTKGDFPIGAVSSGTNKWSGDFSDMWMRIGGAVIDLSVEANRRQFITAEGTPANPTGWPSGGQVQLYGATADWHTNKGTGGGFTLNGALVDGTGPVELP